jgi:hypothetical protein
VEVTRKPPDSGGRKLADAVSIEAGLHQRYLRFGGLERSYLLYIPPKPAEPAPLIFALHGGGGTAEAMARRRSILIDSDTSSRIASMNATSSIFSSKAGPQQGDLLSNPGPAFHEFP